MPVWAWIGGGILVLLLVCCAGGFGLLAVLGDDEDPTPTATSNPTETTSDPTTPTTTDAPPADTPTTDSPTATPTTPPTTPSQSVPPTPSGGTANDDSQHTLASDEVETQVARGMAQFGHTKEDISCPEDLVMIKGRTTTCTGPSISGSGDADITVEVAWAVITGGNQMQYYLTFEQREN